MAACADLVGPAPDGAGAADATAAATATGSLASNASATTASAQSGATTASTGGGTCFAGPLDNPNASRIAVGEDHVCAVRPGPGGNVLTCFGSNAKGQTAPDGCASAPCPPTDVDLTSVFGTSRPRVVTAGDTYTCVVSEAGAVVCFGESLPGGLGANAMSTGLASPGLVGVDYVAARGNTTCAIGGSAPMRTLSCFGDNSRGQIDPSMTNAMSPVLVANQALDVAVGNHFVLFEQEEGVYAQGRSDSDVVSQAGCDETVAAPELLQSCALAAPRQLAAGDDFACMLRPEQSKCWGATTFLDGGCMAAGCNLPVCDCRGGILGAQRIAGGRSHVCAVVNLATERQIACAGEGSAAGSADLAVPFEPIDVAVSHDVSCALGPCGEVACWGNGADGQLGARLMTSHVPVLVID